MAAAEKISHPRDKNRVKPKLNCLSNDNSGLQCQCAFLKSINARAGEVSRLSKWMCMKSKKQCA